MNLPKDPKLEDLTKEQLVYLIRYELFIRTPSAHSLRYVIWHVESKRIEKQMKRNLEAGNRLIGGKTTEARRAYLENLKEFDRLQEEWNQLSQYFDKVVMVMVEANSQAAPIEMPPPPAKPFRAEANSQAVPIELPAPPKPIRIIE